MSDGNLDAAECNYVFFSSMTYSAAEMGVLRDLLPRLAEKEFGYCFLKK